ncbi:MAG: toxin-antitoxin system HicB family antitoxin [Candidatus Dormibacteraceae bacterium]
MKVEEYLGLPYEITLVHDQDQAGNSGWVAEIEDLPGCLSQGSTPEQALVNIREAMISWLTVALEDGVDVPRPRASSSYSGRFIIRLPQSLHAELARTAKREGVSLNLFVANALAGVIAWRQGESCAVTA